MKTIEAFYDVAIEQSTGYGQVRQLCLRQSSGNSSGPKVNIAPGIQGKLPLNHHIRQVETAGRSKDPGDLPKRPVLVRREIDDSIGHHYVDTGVLHG